MLAGKGYELFEEPLKKKPPPEQGRFGASNLADYEGFETGVGASSRLVMTRSMMPYWVACSGLMM